jgi:hypothetical protein
MGCFGFSRIGTKEDVQAKPIEEIVIRFPIRRIARLHLNWGVSRW